MWEKILLALGGGATTFLATMAQIVHNRKIEQRRQETEREKISEERIAADAANAIERERVDQERDANEAAQMNAERLLYLEQQKALQELVRFYREELTARMALFDELEARLEAANRALANATPLTPPPGTPATALPESHSSAILERINSAA
jgi:chromosome segregation ATPase